MHIFSWLNYRQSQFLDPEATHSSFASDTAKFIARQIAIYSDMREAS